MPCMECGCSNTPEDYEELWEENAKLRYALARLRWAHALDMETMIDELYSNRPFSWRVYHKSKTYWFRKCQKLKKELKEWTNV